MVETNEKQTASCANVRSLIGQVDNIDHELFNQLSDAFTDFECSWKQHANEYHQDSATHEQLKQATNHVVMQRKILIEEQEGDEFSDTIAGLEHILVDPGRTDFEFT